MRELRSCDFCGDAAAGIFEVLPPEFTPAADQRRVILCTSCQETLTDVIEPLISRLGSTTNAASSESTSDAIAPSSQSASTRGESVASADVEADTVPEPEDESDPSPPAGTETDAETDTDTDAGADPASEPTTDPLEATSQAHAENGVLPNKTSENANRPEPPKFRQVIRILQNREFPVNRAEVEDLAANAYALEDDEVQDIFEYAIERGLLEEDGGQLRKA